MVFVHPNFTKGNPINELISLPQCCIPYLKEKQKELWLLVESLRSKGIENPTWDKRLHLTVYQIKDHEGRITERPYDKVGDFIITEEVCTKILNGLAEIETAMHQDFSDDSKKIRWTPPPNEKLSVKGKKCLCPNNAFGHRDFCTLCNEKINYYHIIASQIQALHKEHSDLKKIRDEKMVKERDEVAHNALLKMLWAKYKPLFGKDFERVIVTRREKVGNHKEYHNAVMRNSIKIPAFNPHNKALVPTYRIGTKAVKVDDYETWEETTDDFKLSSKVEADLLKEITGIFGTFEKRLYRGGGQFEILIEVKPKGRELYYYLLKTANKYYKGALEEAKSDRLATLEAHKRLEADKMEQRVLQKMKDLNNN